jgi:hypothetical protein
MRAATLAVALALAASAGMDGRDGPAWVCPV